MHLSQIFHKAFFTQCFFFFIFQLTIAIETRYLQTSFEDCTKRRNPKGVGACWLFRKCSYEPYLQFNEITEGDIPHSFSSSEELVIYEPDKKLPGRKVEHNSGKFLITSLKRQTKNDENDYDDLRTFLLESTGENGGHSSSKTKTQSKCSSKKKENEQIHNKKKASEQTNNRNVSKENRSHENRSLKVVSN